MLRLCEDSSSYRRMVTRLGRDLEHGRTALAILMVGGGGERRAVTLGTYSSRGGVTLTFVSNLIQITLFYHILTIFRM